MTSSEHNNNPEQRTLLIQAIEESSDKLFFSKYKSPISDELNTQLEQLKSKIAHNKIDHEQAAQLLEHINAKIGIIQQIVDLQAKLPAEPERPEETRTNPDAQQAWFDNHMDWEASHRALTDKIGKLEKQLAGGNTIWSAIKRGFGL